MNWKQFLKVAYPENLVIEESHKDVIFQSHRWIGLRIAYIFYRLGMSANFISISRMLIALISLYLISLAVKGSVWLPLIGTFLLYGQNILDYSDGAVARASGKVSKLGKELEEIVNSFSRAAILVLMGFLTEYRLAIIFSVFSVFILINFRERVGFDFSGNTTIFKVIKFSYRILLSIQFMLFIIPISFALVNISYGQITTFSYFIVVLYTLLAICWIILCLWKKNN